MQVGEFITALKQDGIYLTPSQKQRIYNMQDLGLWNNNSLSLILNSLVPEGRKRKHEIKGLTIE